MPSQIYQNVNGDNHTQYTFSCLYNAAPQASYWHKSIQSTNSGFAKACGEWLASNGIVTCSKSTASQYNTENYSEYMAIDMMPYAWPFTLVCLPSGNILNGDDVAEWNCFNGLNVGSVTHTNLSTYDRSYFSKWRNTSSKPYHELPHVLAPGAPPATEGGTWWLSDGCVTPPQGAQGTSFSAPIAAGIAACVIGSRPNHYASWPELTRATLMLTAHDVVDGHWASYVDGKDGTGCISGYDAAAFAHDVPVYYDPLNPASEQGAYLGSWYGGDYADRGFNIRIPSAPPAGKHLRLILVWDSRPDAAANVNRVSDLDLQFQANGGVWYGSYGMDNNVEVVDIPNRAVTAGQSYWAIVSPWSLDLPAAPNNFFYLTLCWGWVRDHAN